MRQSLHPTRTEALTIGSRGWPLVCASIIAHSNVSPLARLYQKVSPFSTKFRREFLKVSGVIHIGVINVRYNIIRCSFISVKGRPELPDVSGIMNRFLRGACAALLAVGVISTMSCSSDTRKVAEVGGEGVELQEYRYYFLNNKRELYGDDAELDDASVAELKKMCGENVKNRHALSLLAKEYGAKLSEDDDAKLDELVEALKSNYADDDAYKAALTADFLTEDLYRELNGDTLLAYNVVEKMKEKGELPADDDTAAIDAALMSDEMACVKEIYVYYPSDETREIALNRANEAYSRLMSGESFEDLMREYSSYSAEQVPYDAGYYTMRYDALDEVWAEVEKLSPGEHSGVFESTYGFHIVLKCEKDAAYMAEHREELYDIYSHSKFYERFYALYDTLTVTMTGYGEKLDFRGLSMGEK